MTTTLRNMILHLSYQDLKCSWAMQYPANRKRSSYWSRQVPDHPRSEL
jgi:hypothetical protein